MVEPDCVLIDINLPGMNGLELARQLRERYGKGIVLVAVTGWGEPEARVSAAFSDLDHYLRKPVSQEQLRTLLPPQKD
jgi:CheY-like chemotaxis protein